MHTSFVVGLIIFFFVVPIILTNLARKHIWIQSIGVVTFCYAIGILIGNLQFIPIPEKPVMSLVQILVPLSIPLLLFQTDWSIWKTKGKMLLKSYVLGIVCVLLACTAASYLFRSIGSEVNQMSGMMVGVFTGGTMNMSAIGLALEVEEETFLVLNIAETIVGGIWLFFLLGLSKRFFSLFLRSNQEEDISINDTDFDDRVRTESWKGFVISFVILAFSAGLSFLIAGKMSELIVILSITTLGLIASRIPQIRSLRGSYGIGNYLLLVFCVSIGTLADLTKMLSAGPDILIFVLFIFFFLMIGHTLLAKAFNIDVDSFIISSTAGIYGPAFIAPVANAIRNPSLIAIGIALTIVGFAVGNYLGLVLNQFLNWLHG